MQKNARIYVAGHQGLAGSAIVRKLASDGYTNLITRARSELNLIDQEAARHFFSETRPDYVFLAAAKVGGIYANSHYPAEFIYDNLTIQNNVIHSAHLYGVKRLLFLGSSCIYPRLAEQPMKETSLLTGSLEPTNEPYAIAKIAGIKMCESYNRQYGSRFYSVMPTNLYGPGDNFNLENSHVLPALIRKFHAARESGAQEVVVWGSGTAMREFMHVDDMASACVFVMSLADETVERSFLAYPSPAFVNVGTGRDVTIRQLAESIRDIIGFRGDLVFDTGKPDGAPRKLLDVSRLAAMGWTAEIELREGIASTYNWYLEHFDRFRD